MRIVTLPCDRMALICRYELLSSSSRLIIFDFDEYFHTKIIKHPYLKGGMANTASAIRCGK